MPEPYERLKARIAAVPGVLRAAARRPSGVAKAAGAAAAAGVPAAPVLPSAPALQKGAIAPVQALVQSAAARVPDQSGAGLGVYPVYRAGQTGVSEAPERTEASRAQAKTATRQALEDYLWEQAKLEYVQRPDAAVETAPLEIGFKGKKTKK